MNMFSISVIMGLFYDDDRIYFISAYIYAVMVYDCHTKKVDILSDFPEEVQFVRAFEKIIKYDGKIYLFPCFAEDIYCYDLGKDEYYRLNILSTVLNRMNKRKRLSVLAHAGRIYCICRCPNMVICIDPKTDEFQIHMMPQELLREEETAGKPFFDGLIKGDHLIYPYMNNAIIEFSLEEKVFTVNYLDETLEEPSDNIYDIILGMCIDPNGVIWICDASGQVFQIVSNRRIKISVPDDFIERYNDGYRKRPGFHKILMIGNDLCFILRSACKIQKYNIDTQDSLWDNNDLAEWNSESSQVAFFHDAQIDDETFWLYNQNDNAVYKWNYKEGFTEKVELKISIDTLLGSRLDENRVLNVIRREDDLNGYIQYIKCGYGNSMQEKHINCGEKIYYELL